MASMLDIAGGVVIGGFMLGLLYGGFGLWATSKGPSFESVFGCLLMIVAGGLIFWLLFVHTGIVPFH